MLLFDKELESQYYQTINPKEGIYAFLDAYDRLAGCNAGLIDIGDRVVVFDTFYNPEAAKALHSAAKKLANSRPITVINSHSHIDHIVGNQYFEDCSIISSELCRNAISGSMSEIVKEISAFSTSDLEALKKRYNEEADELKKLELKNEVRYFDYLKKEPIYPAMPDLTFSNKLFIHGSKRSIELYSFEVGHSQGDLMMYIPEEKILFTGDILFNEEHPWLGSGDYKKIIEINRFMLELEVELVVPGHGTIGNKKSIEGYLEYINHILSVAEEAAKQGKSPESVLDSFLKAPYDKWDGKIRGFNSLEFFIKQFS